jgi:hypothetical protein
VSLLEEILGGLGSLFAGPPPRRHGPSRRPLAAPDLGDVFEAIFGGAAPPSSAVAGPFRSESSNPAVNPALRHRPEPLDDPFSLPPGRLHFDPQQGYEIKGNPFSIGDLPRELANVAADTIPAFGTPGHPNPVQRPLGEVERFQRIAEAKRDAENDPSTLDVLSIASLGIPGLGAVGAGLRGARGLEIAAQALRGAEGASRAASAARAVAPAARVAGRAVTLPVRSKRILFGGPLALEAPSAAFHGDPGQFENALEGTGVAASIANTAGEAAGHVIPGVAGNLVKDALQLPAQALPSVYLPAAGAVEAAQGDSSRISKLWEDYKATGLFPHLLSGDLGGAAKAFEEHPLFTGLEASGGYALGGRGLRRVAETGALGPELQRSAGTVRDPLQMYGDVAQPREYSRNLITNLLQRAEEGRIEASGRRTRATGGRRDPMLRDPSQASPAQVDQYIRGAALEGARAAPTGLVDRLVSDLERTRRSNQQQVRQYRGEGQVKAYKSIPALIAQGEVRTPATFYEDLARTRDKLLAARQETGEGALLRSELANNTTQLRDVEKALTLPPNSPQIAELFNAAEHYGKGLKPLEKEIVDLGLYDPESVRVAKLFPYAIAHEGATFGRPADITARHSEVLSTISDLEKNRDIMRGLEKRGSAEDRAAATAAREGLTDQIKQLRNESRAMLHEHPERLLDRSGAPMDINALEQRVTEALGGREPAFLTHRPGFRGRGNYYQSAYSGRGRGRSQRRTGEAFRRGGYDASLAALDEQHLHLQTIADRARHADQIVSELAMRQPNGSWWSSWQNAANVARDPEAFGLQLNGVAVKPIRIAPMRALARELDAVRGADHQNAQALTPEELLNPDVVPVELRTRVRQALEQALQPGSGKGDIGLIPEAAAQRLLEHNTPPRQFEKVLQSYTSAFKNTVLPLSDKWMLGNIFEVSMRSMFNGLGLGQPGTTFGQRTLGKRYLGELEAQAGPEARRHAEAQLIGEGQYGSVKQTEINRREMHGFSKAMEAVRATPGPREVMHVWDRYKQAVFGGNAWLERQPRYAALGRQVKRQVDSRVKKFHTALGVSDDALRDLVKGDLKTGSQERYDHYIADVFGNWTRLSPDARYVLTTYAPFYMWARASARFVFLTLPIKHPVKTAMLAAANEMTQEERQRLGLDLFTKDRLPGFLQGSLPVGAAGDPRGDILPATNYSSFGVFANYPNALSGFILPQFGGAIDTLRGIAWTGKKIQKSGGGEPDPAELAALAFYTQLEATMPVLALARRVEEGGGSSEDTSTVVSPKVTEGTQEGRSLLGGLERAFGFRTYGGPTLDFLRSLPTAQEITVPSSDSAASEATGGVDPDYINSLINPSEGGAGGVTADDIDKLLNP